jgi:hypothetical protein
MLIQVSRPYASILLVLAAGPEGIDAHTKELDGDPLLLADALPERRTLRLWPPAGPSRRAHTHRIKRRVWPHAAAVDRRRITFFSPTPHPQSNYLLGAGKRSWGVDVLNSHSLTLLNSHYREPINRYSVSCSSNSHSLVRTPPNQTRRVQFAARLWAILYISLSKS